MEAIEYAYLKIKLSENQKSFCGYVARKGGKTDHIGVDYGGWTAHNKILTALKKKGVMVQTDEFKMVLVKGDPIVIPDPKFGKPYLKVKKEIIWMYSGYDFENFDCQVYLDPRETPLFLVLFPYDISTMLDKKLLLGMARHRHPNVSDSKYDPSYLCAIGTTYDECIANVNNLTTMFEVIKDADLHDVLNIVFKTSTAPAGKQHSNTGLEFQYFRVMQASHNQELYIEDKKGILRKWGYRHDEQHSITIPWTEDREQALENLRLKLEKAGDELRKILFAETFIKMLDSNTQLKLEA